MGGLRWFKCHDYACVQVTYKLCLYASDVIFVCVCVSDVPAVISAPKTHRFIRTCSPKNALSFVFDQHLFSQDSIVANERLGWDSQQSKPRH